MFPLEVRGPDRVVKDRFNNEVTVQGEWETINVVAWAVQHPVEKEGESIDRTITELVVYALKDTFPAPDSAQQIRLADGTEWEAQGLAEDYTNGPWWDPGMLVLHYRSTEG
ncbi:hypothetical protein [Corynebacterium pygosceleis]|uniref:hypothetical protein n=1 Tax=Corynebacterium pygosceleis TaxID=2800406 RepID=UPI002005E1C3|nr:hypothetical protein [Corynebacterium pygosceleis]MCK7676355.1 hypothetical protein [Corynebacterium pygosceleis]